MQRGGRRFALDRLRHRVEVAGADLALVLDRGEALVGRFELGLLQFDERAHLRAGIAVREVEHRVVQRVEAGQRDELELVAHRAEFLLELRDRRVVEVLLPVERRRAVVRQHLARELLVDRLRELLRVLEIRLARLAPHEVRIRRIREAARDRLLEARLGAEEAFDRALAVRNGLSLSSMSDVMRSAASASVRATRTVGVPITSAASRAADSFATASRVGTSTLPPMWPHFFTDASWSSKWNTRRAGLDHRLHQLERVQHAAEAGFRVRDDRREEIDVAFVAGVLAFRPLDLVGARQRVVDALDDERHRVRRIQRLVRVHFTGDVRVAGHLPARQIDGLQPGLHLLHRLVACERAQRIDEWFLVDEPPELFRAALRERVLDGDRAAQADHVVGRVAALDARPARIGVPLLLQFQCLLLSRHDVLLDTVYCLMVRIGR